MSRLSTPVRRSGGSLDVYTALLCAAVLVLAVGVYVLATSNIEHSATGSSDGGVLKLVD